MCMHVYVYARICVCGPSYQIHMYMYMYMHVYVCIYLYVYIHEYTEHGPTISLQNNRARTRRRTFEKLCFAILNLQEALGALGSPGKLRRSSGRALGEPWRRPAGVLGCENR